MPIKPKPRCKIKPDWKERAEHLIKNTGLTNKQIAAIVGVEYNTLRAFITRHGLSRSKESPQQQLRREFGKSIVLAAQRARVTIQNPENPTQLMNAALRLVRKQKQCSPTAKQKHRRIMDAMQLVETRLARQLKTAAESAGVKESIIVASNIYNHAKMLEVLNQIKAAQKKTRVGRTRATQQAMQLQALQLFYEWTSRIQKTG